MIQEKKRIDFIDLAKGVCITLVVLHHCHIETPYLIYVRMPLYFILSGLFFKTYEGFYDFTKRKINKILIPFIFYYSLSFGIYLLLSHLVPGIRVNSEVERFFFLDPLYSRLCFNNPLWFLLSLFWCNILFYLITLISKKIWVQTVISISFAVVYTLIKGNDITLPLYFAKSLLYFPYFFVGSLLRKTSLLYKEDGTSFLKKNKDCLLGGAFFILFVLLANFGWKNDIIAFVNKYCISFSGVLALLLLLKRINYIPVISYYGRYSIVILCTSYLVYSPLRVLIPRVLSISGQSADYIAFFVTMFAEYFIIMFCIRYLPYVTAQKDLLPVGKTR